MPYLDNTQTIGERAPIEQSASAAKIIVAKDT